MNLILEKDITPPKEEYNELKDLDETQNVSRLAKTYANTYVDAAENLNRWSVPFKQHLKEMNIESIKLELYLVCKFFA